MPDHDVAIIGAGPVGLLLACLLAQAGVDVVVFEAREGADRRSRAIGIHPPGRDALEAAGLGARVREEALELDGGEVICGGRMLTSVSFAAGQRVLILPQHRTHALLLKRLSQLAEGALLLGRGVTGMRQEGDAVRLEVDASPDVTARFAVCADGVRSGLRRQLGIAWRARPGRGWYAMADVPGPAGPARAQLYCEPAGLIESFPLPQGRRWVASDPQRVLGDAAAFARAIQERTGIRLDLPVGIQPALFEAKQHLADHPATGRIALLGDAAHETSPIGGQGMNLGWMAARHLAETIRRGLRDGEGDLREYGRSARRAAMRAQRRSFFYMTMGRPARAPQLIARNGVITLLGTAPFRARTADMITMRSR